MANKDRQKRSARKARQAERAQLEQAHAVSQPAQATSKKAEASLSKSSKKEPAKKKGRVATWFSDVKSEMNRVTWPSKAELKNYSIAVICMLIVFGVAVWLIDTGVVAALVGYSGLRG